MLDSFNLKELFSLNGVFLMTALTYIAGQFKSVWFKIYSAVSKRYTMSIVVLGSMNADVIIRSIVDMSTYKSTKEILNNNSLVTHTSTALAFGSYVVRLTPTVWATIRSWQETSRESALAGNLQIFTSINLIGINRKKVYEKLKASVDTQVYGDVQIFVTGEHVGNVDLRPVPLDKKLFGKSIYEIDDIINKWLRSDDIYKMFGKKRKMCLCLHGVPGTGKTSLINRVSKLTGSNFLVYANDIFGGHNLASLTRITQNITETRQSVRKHLKGDINIFIIEEIDKLLTSMSTKHTEPGQWGYELNNTREVALMQFLDGFYTPDNSIIILTTNNRDNLPEALARSGRIDFDINVGNLDREEAEKMVRHYNASIDLLGDDTEFNPAKLENLIFKEKLKQK